MKKLFLKILLYPQETRVVESSLRKLVGLKSETQVLSCEYCKIFKTTYFERHGPKRSRSRFYDCVRL